MTDPYILQAREMLAVECEKRDCHETASNYRKGYCDGHTAMTVLARVLREHDEKQPTFKQRVEAMAKTFGWTHHPSYARYVRDYDRHLAEIITPKPVDPLVEAMDELEWCNPEALASDLRKALADRGLEIREIVK